METIENLLDVEVSSAPAATSGKSTDGTFSLLFFSDVRKDISDATKYEFL